MGFADLDPQKVSLFLQQGRYSNRACVSFFEAAPLVCGVKGNEKKETGLKTQIYGPLVF